MVSVFRGVFIPLVILCCLANLVYAAKFATLTDLVGNMAATESATDTSLLDQHNQHYEKLHEELNSHVEQETSMAELGSSASASVSSTSTSTSARSNPFRDRYSARGRALRRRVQLGGKQKNKLPISMRPKPTFPKAIHRRGWNFATGFLRSQTKRPSFTPPAATTNMRRNVRRRDGYGRIIHSNRERRIRLPRRAPRRLFGSSRRAQNQKLGRDSTRSRLGFPSVVSRARNEKIFNYVNGVGESMMETSSSSSSTALPQVRALKSFDGTVPAADAVTDMRDAQREIYELQRRTADLTAEHRSVLDQIQQARQSMLQSTAEQLKAQQYAKRSAQLKEKLANSFSEVKSHSSYFHPMPTGSSHKPRRLMLPPQIVHLMDERRARRRNTAKRVHMKAKYDKFYKTGIPGSKDSPARREFQAQRLAVEAQERGEPYLLEMNSSIDQDAMDDADASAFIEQSATSAPVSHDLEEEAIAKIRAHEASIPQPKNEAKSNVNEVDDLQAVFPSRQMPTMAPLPPQ